MKKSNVYTFTGDKGTTSLVGGKRIPKTDVRLEAYGTVDELNAQIGFLLSLPDIDTTNRKLLQFVQNKLFVIGSYLATDVSFTELREASKMKEEDIRYIEQRIDEMDETLPSLNAFILPGGTPAASAAHVCRTVCRRAERRICDAAHIHPVDENILRFINRLSDYFFVFSRFNNIENKQNEFLWNKSC